jgi:hypothetical protein
VRQAFGPVHENRTKTGKIRELAAESPKQSPKPGLRVREPLHPIVPAARPRFNGAMTVTRPTKITFADMRDMGVRGLLIYCSDYKCSHSVAISADPWPGDVRLSDIEPLFVCQACGKCGADVRPDFNWNKKPVAAMGYR